MTRDRFGDLLERIDKQGPDRRARRRRPARKAQHDKDVLHNALNLAQTLKGEIVRTEDSLEDLKTKQSELLTSPVLQPGHILTLQLASQSVRQDAEKVSRQLAGLETPRSHSPADARIMENQLQTLRQRVQKIIIDLNISESEFKEHLQERVNRHHLIAGVTSNNLDTSLESMTSLMEPSILLQEDDELKELHHDEKLLFQTEENIHLVNAMFKDLNFVIHRQQSTVETIQKKMQRAQSYIESGKKHLQRLSSVKTSRKKFSKCKIFGISLTTIGVITLTVLLAVLLI